MTTAIPPTSSTPSAGGEPNRLWGFLARNEQSIWVLLLTIALLLLALGVYLATSRNVLADDAKTVLSWLGTRGTSGFVWLITWLSVKSSLESTVLLILRHVLCRRLGGDGAVAVATDIYAHWPLSWVEVVAEATHDTEAGKATAESVIRDSRNAEIEMCVGDEVEVIGLGTLRALLTGTIAPIGTRGIATMIHSTAGFVELDTGTRASIKDVRKVTT